ncbi:hypothetical protein [Actinomadura napierensis]|uniref:Uncharacterized protein n=1 Tax=Actinomadura napierensis TaxID=267854 RepID=A0ABN2YFI2_9ACTN
MAYVLAGQRELGNVLGMPWTFAGRIVPVLAVYERARRLARLQLSISRNHIGPLVGSDFRSILPDQSSLRVMCRS